MEVCRDRTERNHRFLEEALELVQSLGCTQAEAHQLVDYVYGRPAGDPVQELGGVMVTVAALCWPNELDMDAAAEKELARIWQKIDVIRQKQATKPKHSPLPRVKLAVHRTYVGNMRDYDHQEECARYGGGGAVHRAFVILKEKGKIPEKKGPFLTAELLDKFVDEVLACRPADTEVIIAELTWNDDLWLECARERAEIDKAMATVDWDAVEAMASED